MCRPRELARLRRFAEGAEGHMIAVIGPTGSGKSALLEALEGEEIVPTVVVHGGGVGADWPLSGLAAVLAGLDSMLGVETLRVLTGGEDLPLFDLAKLLVAELRTRRGSPVLLIIDDADALDAPSRAVVDHIMRRCGPLGMRTVLGMRAAPADSSFGRVPPLVLAPLGMEALCELAACSAGKGADPAVLLQVAEAASGSPLGVLSILSALPDEVRNGHAPVPVPLRPGGPLAVLLSGRLDALDSAQVDALRVLASAPDVPERVFRALPQASDEAVDELLASRLVERGTGSLRITDRALAAVVYWDQPAAARRALHELLRDAHGEREPILRAWHASSLDPSGADGAPLLDGARSLIEQGRIWPGFEMVERALLLLGDDVPPGALGEVAGALASQAELELASRYVSRVRDLLGEDPPPPGLATIMLYVAYLRGEGISDHMLRSSADLDTGDASGPTGDLLAFAALLRLLRWEVREAEELLAEVRRRTPEGTGLSRAMEWFAGLYARIMRGEDLGPLDELTRCAAPLGTMLGAWMGRALLARALALVERYAEARDLLGGMEDAGTNTPLLRPILSGLIRLDIEIRAGLPARAREVSDRLLSLVGRRTLMRPSLMYTLAEVRVGSGDVRGAEDVLTELQQVIEPGFNARLESEIAAVQGRAALMGGRPEVAAQHFAKARRVGARFRNPQLLRFHDEYVETLYELGRAAEARAVLEELVAQAAEAPSPWTRIAIARSRALLLSGEESLEAYRTTLETWDDAEHEYQRGRVLLACSRRLSLLGRAQEAFECHESALRILSEIGLATSALGMRGSQEPEKPKNPLELLGAKERAVAQLVAQGLRNKAIAADLFVSVRTVELRLTHIYRTLGVSSRAQLMELISISRAAADRAA